HLFFVFFFFSWKSLFVSDCYQEQFLPNKIISFIFLLFYQVPFVSLVHSTNQFFITFSELQICHTSFLYPLLNHPILTTSLHVFFCNFIKDLLSLLSTQQINFL